MEDNAELYHHPGNCWVRTVSRTWAFAQMPQNWTKQDVLRMVPEGKSAQNVLFFFPPWNLTWHKSKARKSQFQTSCARCCLETAKQRVKWLSRCTALCFSWGRMSGSHLSCSMWHKMKQVEVDNSIKKKGWSGICWHDYKTYVQTWTR